MLLWLGACRYKLSSIQTALGLLNEALALADRSGLPCDRLRADVHNWRARCYRRQRDFEAAREDVETALELAEGLNDRRALANAYFQASLVAERQGHWLLARTYAERAKAQYEELADQANVGNLMNNLGGLNLLLGNSESAITFLKDAFRIALDLGNHASAAQAVSSLAQVHLRSGELAQAEEQSRHALELLDGRSDFLDEIGNAQLTLGRALPARRSPSPSRASNSFPPRATAPRPGSPRATSPPVAATIVGPRSCTARLRRPCRTSGSSQGGGDSLMTKARLTYLMVAVLVLLPLVMAAVRPCGFSDGD